jgi:hypothetical protein
MGLLITLLVLLGVFTVAAALAELPQPNWFDALMKRIGL